MAINIFAFEQLQILLVEVMFIHKSMNVFF